jgi:two-component system, chemotaxis family, CheB/CheR fusion protein
MIRSPIVAVASSSGDPEAVCELLSALPSECGLSFIIVQQLASGTEKVLLEAFAARTNLPVLYARDGVVVQEGHFYVITANTTLTVTNGCIHVIPSASGPHHPADSLFGSLAKELGQSAIGVVLSGEGSDGALGVEAIKGVGGTAFAQYPGSARFPSMPISAIETGCVAFVLRPNEIAQALSRVSARSAAVAGVARPRAAKELRTVECVPGT